MEDLAGRIIKGYELHAVVGEGGFGTVYRAFQPAIGREVAIKVIIPKHANQPDFIRRFEIEAQVIARLEHPHIVPLYDYWRDPEGAFLVMRWLPHNLRTSIERGAWTLDAVANLLDQIAGALSVAHREGIIHRDLKPDNILLDEDENAYLADFGIAKNIHLRDPHQTAEGEIVGSPAYLSPEQIRASEITPRSDLYSLGYVIYEILSGNKPFPEATTASDYIQYHLSMPLPMVSIQDSRIPAAVDEVLQTATAKDPAHRYPSALRFAAAFRAALPNRQSRMPDQPLVDTLTGRELEVLHLMVEEFDNNVIAERLVLTLGSVRWYIKQIYSKLDVHSRQQAIDRALSLHLLEHPRPAHDLMVSAPAYDDQPTFRGLEAALPLVEPDNPYKGLRAFQEADSADFFGRAALTERLLSRLSESGEAERFLVLVGPSGSGKSSVVRAGLIPALRKGAIKSAPRPFVADFAPGTHPLEELEAALLRVSVQPIPGLLDQLREDRRGLVRAAKRLLPSDNETELVLVIDQFEEIFTLVEDEAVRSHFIDNLLAAATDPRGRIRIILTLRADFYDRPLLYPRLAEIVRSHTEVVTPLTECEMEQSITAPAERVGLRIEPGLVATILKDVGEQPGTLPLLQFALTELFERREGVVLTVDAYQATGGVLGALGRRADQIFQSLDPAAQALARQIFLRLVTLGEGTEDTRRRALLAELNALSQPGVVEDVINVFAGYRLLTLDRDPLSRNPTVEIAHEAMIREWSQLRQWLIDSREDIRIQRRLAQAAWDWNSGRDSSYLVSGSRLTQFETWAIDTELILTANERAFLDASLAERSRNERIEQERRAHETALERRSVKVLRMLVGVLTVAVLVTIGLSAFAVEREQQAVGARATSEANLVRAEREVAVNRSLVLANQAQVTYQSGQSELSLKLALEAVNIPNPPAEAEEALRTVALGPGSRAVFTGEWSQVRAVAFSPDSKLAASGACRQLESEACQSGEIRLWDVTTATELRQFDQQPGSVTRLVFTPDGKTLWSAFSGGALLLWDADPDSATLGSILQTYPLDAGAINALALNPDGSMLVAGTEQAKLIFLDAPTGNILRQIDAGTASVTSVAFSPDGQTVLSGAEDGSVILWDANTGETIRQFESHTNSISKVIFNPVAPTILTSSTDFTLRLWDMDTGTELKNFRSSTLIYDFSVSSDGQTALVDYGGGALVLFDLENWQVAHYLLANSTGLEWTTGSETFAIALALSGELALTGQRDGTITLWNLGIKRDIYHFPTNSVTGGFISMSLSPDNRRLAAGSFSGETILFDSDPTSPNYGAKLTQLTAHEGLPAIVEFSPDGRQVIVGSGDWVGGTDSKSLKLWNIDESSPNFGSLVRAFTDFPDLPRSIAFTPDGSKLLVGTAILEGSGGLVMLDIASGKKLMDFPINESVANILVRPDSRRAITAQNNSNHLSEWDIDPNSPTFGQEVRRMETHGYTFDLAWGPGGTTFFDSELTERDYATGKPIHRLGGTTATAWSIDVSPDGHSIAAGFEPGRIIVWDYETGNLLWQSAQSSLVNTLAFSRDSHSLFSLALADAPVQWRVSEPSTTELMTWIQSNRYLRDFTCAERTQYQLEPLCDPANS